MLGLLVAAATAVASPTPLKTIVHVRSSPFCSALHDDIAPAVFKLIEKKPIVTGGKSLLLKLADDQVRGSMAIDLHMVQLNDVIGPMAQNLIDAQHALDEVTAVTGAPHTQQEQLLVELRSELTQIIEQQNVMLNVFSGTYGSFTSTQLLRQGVPDTHDDPNKDAAIPFALEIKDKSGDAKPAASPTPNAYAKRSDPAPGAAVKYVDIGLAGRTHYAALFNEVTRYQTAELQVESQAYTSILQAASLCR